MSCIGIGSKLANDCTGADNGAPGFWQGKMDDVGIWNRGLSPQEIQAIFKRGQAGKALDEIIITDGLIGYFPLDETTGLTAADSSARRELNSSSRSVRSGGATDTGCGGADEPRAGAVGSWKLLKSTMSLRSLAASQ